MRNMHIRSLGMVALLLLAGCANSPDQSATTAGAAVAAGAPAAARGGTQADLAATVGDRVFFDFDRSNLKPEARMTIQRWSDWLKKYPNTTATIEGHCDERGTREYNIALGERRASATKNFLTALGIDPKRVSTISYGKERPAVVGSTEAAWAQNRRAVLVIN